MTDLLNKNKFIIVICLAHFSPLVWNLPQPLLETENSQVVNISPFNPADESSSESLSSSSSSDEMINFEPPPPNSNGGGNVNNKKETRDIHGRGPEVGALCSIFRTFLDARDVNCRFTRQPQFPVDQGILNLNDQQDGPPNDVNLLESNNLLPHGEHLIIDDQSNSRIDSIPLPPPPIPLDENGEDETKVIRSKTMIVVPERSCPPGKRRDVRGYCRTVIIRFANGPSRGGPIRFYYRRFVSVPTLHFILP